MIKAILAFFVINISNLYALPSFLKGFFLQPEVGLTRQTTSLQIEYRDPGAFFTDKKILNHTHPSFALSFGKNFIQNKTFFAVAASTLLDSTKGHGLAAEEQAEPVDNIFKRKTTFSVRGLAGTQFTHSASLFLIAEILTSKFHYKVKPNNGFDEERSKKNALGIGGGIGVRTQALGFQYTYHRYQAIWSGNMITFLPGAGYYAKIKPRFHNALFTFTIPLKP